MTESFCCSGVQFWVSKGACTAEPRYDSAIDLSGCPALAEWSVLKWRVYAGAAGPLHDAMVQLMELQVNKLMGALHSESALRQLIGLRPVSSSSACQGRDLMLCQHANVVVCYNLWQGSSGSDSGWEGEVCWMLDAGFEVSKCPPMFYTVKVLLHSAARLDHVVS